MAQDLSSVVFERAFPTLVGALADASGASLADVRHAALIFLYRLLFVLYAEDRGLLPVNDSRYDDYGLRKRVRDDVARRMRDGDTFSGVASSYYDHFTTLCRLIDEGDPSIGLPPYNGGLFAADAAPLLESVRLPDVDMAPIVHDLSHTLLGRTAPLRQLPRHVRAAARLNLPASARARAGARRGRRHRHPAQHLRPQGQRQLLHAPGAGRPHSRPYAQAARGRAPRGVRGRSPPSSESDRRPQAERRYELRKLDPPRPYWT